MHSLTSFTRPQLDKYRETPLSSVTVQWPTAPYSPELEPDIVLTEPQPRHRTPPAWMILFAHLGSSITLHGVAELIQQKRLILLRLLFRFFSLAIFCPKIACQAPKSPNLLLANNIRLAF
jgi:hypothetical protein